MSDSDKQVDTKPGYLNQNWKGMSGAVAWHLIERHAENWGQIEEMMQAWLKANK